MTVYYNEIDPACVHLLVDGLPGRVDLWRIGGNAIVPQAAAQVLGSLVDMKRGI